MKITFLDGVRINIFKKQLEENNIKLFDNLDDEEILKILDLTVLPNALNRNSFKITVLFYMIFYSNKQRNIKGAIEFLNKASSFVSSLSKTEKVIIKYGVVKGFQTSHWKREFWNFIKNPLSLESEGTGRKIMSSYRFKDIFKYAYKLVTKAKNNERIPRI